MEEDNPRERVGERYDSLAQAVTIGEMQRAMRNLLAPLYVADRGTRYESSREVTEDARREASAVVKLIFHHLKGWSATDLIIHEPDEVSPILRAQIGRIVERAMRNEPIQYIIGEGRFYGMDLQVDRRVLIPRPETEQLVDMIVKEYGRQTDLRVLDVGTGSGAIAIALSRNLPFSQVEALDISSDAIEVARANATRLKARIRFIEADVFSYEPRSGNLDIIVSNPPYIADSEKESMENNVLDYEPHGALFVSDGAPLVYYSRIATIGMKALVPGGRLYFEINPRYSVQLHRLLEDEGYADVEIRTDFAGKARFAVARRP